jgi:ATP-dependent RNA helicase DDX51/DBP6
MRCRDLYIFAIRKWAIELSASTVPNARTSLLNSLSTPRSYIRFTVDTSGRELKQVRLTRSGFYVSVRKRGLLSCNRTNLMVRRYSVAVNRGLGCGVISAGCNSLLARVDTVAGGQWVFHAYLAVFPHWEIYCLLVTAEIHPGYIFASTRGCHTNQRKKDLFPFLRMASFYSRYVPGSNNEVSSEPAAVNKKKRKFGEEIPGSRQDTKRSEESIPRGKGKKESKALPNRKHVKGKRKSPWPKHGIEGNIFEDAEEVETTTETLTGQVRAASSEKRNGQHLGNAHRDTSFDVEGQNGSVSGTRKGTESDGTGDKEGTLSKSFLTKNKEREEMPSTKRNASKNAETDPELPDGGKDPHSNIRSKFQKAKQKAISTELDQEDASEHEEKDDLPETELHGLEPLPQPPPVIQEEGKPAFSSLPPWLAYPLRVDAGHAVEFCDLGLDPPVIESITKQGLQTTFPVQSAVIPLLTDGLSRHRGDLCISAATGSGKTLAYVLPMIQHLRRLATTKLRGLIVVPTRELVKQAKEICETFAVGSNVRIATALGSRSIRDEQEALVERYEIYDPEEYQVQQDASVDWDTVHLEDLFSEIETEAQPAPNFVVKYRSKVDVIICTPGRLVDHIRSTKGFTLDDVQWLAIDEADRLLNESFQEWTEIVIPALQSRASYALQDNMLRRMRFEIPERAVQKVILSATLTQDISKLNCLKLRNPKLVVVGNVSAPTENADVGVEALERQHDEGSTFNLPPTLAEYAVPVGDGSDKPLYLLELLRTKVHIFNLDSSRLVEPGTATNNDQDLSSDLSTSDSASDSGSDSDSESTISSTTSSSASSTSARQRSRGRVQTKDRQTTNNTALIFTRSTESATRLTRLLSLLSKPLASLTATLTKSSTSSSTRKALTNFRNHKIRVIIATDRASRGLDLPNLGHVVSYDVPSSMTTYVHRVGRTARAGKVGTAWTLLAHREARWFWNEIGKGTAGEAGKIVRNEKVKRSNLGLEGKEDDGTRERYEKALKTLGEEVVGVAREGRLERRTK